MSGKTPPPRVVNATIHRKNELVGPINILSNTKHGPTTLIGVEAGETLHPGDILKTNAWVFGSKQLSIVKAHDKEMKIPGVWYVVKAIAPPKT